MDIMDIGENYDKIYRYCYFKLRSREIAEDITQETFLRYFERAEYRSGNALQCLYTIARNLCTDEYRRQKPEELTDDIPQTSGEEEALSRIAVRKALSKLSEDEREILLLRYANDLQVGVLAKIFGVSRFSMRRRINSALKKLRSELEREGIYE